MNHSMQEAMRLMRTGDLGAATAAIQRGLGGAAPPERDVPVERDVTPAPAEIARAGFHTHTHAGPAGTRRYKLFVPSAQASQPLPLVVMLHGCTQSPDDFATGTRMNALAEERGCFVAYPEQSQNANGSKCWNWFKSGDQRRGAGEPGVIAELVGELIEKNDIDSRRVYVAGLSAGGAMAVILGQAYPDVFAAVGVHSGLPYAAAHDMPSAFAAMQNPNGAGASADAIPTIVFHGDRDTTVNPANGERVLQSIAARARESSNASGDALGGHSYTRRAYTDERGALVAEHWLVHGAAHAWSGGDARGTFTDARGPDASREMLRFFLER